MLRAWGWKGQIWRLDPWERQDRSASVAELREFKRWAQERLPDELPSEEVERQMQAFFDSEE